MSQIKEQNKENENKFNLAKKDFEKVKGVIKQNEEVEEEIQAIVEKIMKKQETLEKKFNVLDIKDTTRRLKRVESKMKTFRSQEARIALQRNCESSKTLPRNNMIYGRKSSAKIINDLNKLQTQRNKKTENKSKIKLVDKDMFQKLRLDLDLVAKNNLSSKRALLFKGT